MDTKNTPEPWVVKHSLSKNAFNVVGTRIGHMYKISRCPYFNEFDKEEARANAELIAEAGNVYIETGKTPRQLADINAELLEALQEAEMVLWMHSLEIRKAGYNPTDAINKAAVVIKKQLSN